MSDGRGRNFVAREVRFGRVWRANPMRVLEERGSFLALWSPSGAPRYVPVDGDGREVRIPRTDGWKLEERITPHDSLWLVHVGARHAISLFWVDGAFSHWYVNFERHVGRGETTLDYVDDKLDLIVRPDGSVRWKDEDELAEAAAQGFLDEAEVRAEAERVLADPPWPTGWEEFEPGPGWPLPELPQHWDTV